MKKNNFHIIGKTVIVLLLLKSVIGTGSLLCQDPKLSDTVRIREVVIRGRIENNSISPGYKKSTIDSVSMTRYGTGSLSNLISACTGIVIKSYGVSGLSTPGFRGTGSSHTLVQWNGISVINPMLGQTDLSILPAGMADDIEIMYGSASLSYGTGGIGGIINIRNKPSWGDGNGIFMNTSAGSFGTYSGLLKVKAGNSSFQSVTKAYLKAARNNFPYMNRAIGPDPVKEIMNNSEAVHKGFLQELYYRKNNNTLSTRLWYQNADRNLPASMMTGEIKPDEDQTDQSLRSVTTYERTSGITEYFITGAFNFSELNYTNRLASINSDNRSNSFILKTGLTSHPGNFLIARATIENENTFVRSVNYENSRASSNLASLTLAAETSNPGIIKASFLIKELLHDNIFLLPDFSGGIQIAPLESKEVYLKANYSKNTRIPSMNDLYWNPGGNRDLKNENAQTLELIFEYNQDPGSNLKFNFSTSYYHNFIRNLIQWLPGEYSYWTSGNVKKVHTSGFESSLSAGYTEGTFSSVFSLSIFHTRAETTESEIANDESVGRQLIYVPVNSGNASLNIKQKGFFLNWISSYTGKRFITADNSSALSSYFLSSVTTGYEFKRVSGKYVAGFSVDNIFGENYEMVSWYPQPGRSYSVNLIINLKHNKK